MNSVLTFIRKWTLPISMLVGVASYFGYTSIQALNHTHAFVNHAISIIQPSLIFAMLLLTFLKIKPSQLRLQRWHLWALMLQLSLFCLCAFCVRTMANSHWAVVVEGGMLCLICPTATAAVVVTGKLGGNQAALTTYTILINLAVAIIVPAIVPFLHPSADNTFISDATLILSKVFPLLFCPFLLSIVVRKIAPKLADWLTSIKDLAFYLWAVALALAIAVTVRSIVHSSCPWEYQLGIAIASAIACAIQFGVGRLIGHHYHDKVTMAQSLGQKNTVFAIWMGYTFLTPVTSIAGGFYSVWHNVYNSYQLAKRKE